ncbi:hypothetical protein [Mesorhizobium sp. WSM3862]|uniref:hypothetical protein n=1 Tax=Mesorhizobium sp. WSM3862 TaxID=632858 RepID=UPI000BAF2EB9|nr:hypothetical protein [Mesorhizobium sp. WSM3862]PBB94980.1 hypothetical protein CK224_29220 [Mesorhizobium sp. WSM3862]
MTTRILLNSDRLLITKPGIDASLSPPDPDKVFDSDWAFGGGLVVAGFKEFAINTALYGTGATLTIDFPELTYTPTVTLWEGAPPDSKDFGGTLQGYAQMTPYWQRFANQGDPGTLMFQYVTVTTSQIIIPYWPSVGSGGSWTHTGGPSPYQKTPGSNQQLYRGFYYMVFAV